MDAVVLLISSQDVNDVTVWSTEDEAKAAAVESFQERIALTNPNVDTTDWDYDDYTEFAEVEYCIYTQLSFHLLPTKEQQ
tara:strand:- start:225 stop:464 length:240 start_codon:yes stop_codon:yes gene_type:complete